MQVDPGDADVLLTVDDVPRPGLGEDARCQKRCGYEW
jgi:hypothetical protein